MFTNKKELIKQVNWALRLREPLCCGEVNDVRSKWTSEGYEVRFDGGSAMIAHFAGQKPKSFGKIRRFFGISTVW